MVIAKLATKPSITAEAKEDVGKILADLARMFDADDIGEIVTIVKHLDGTWSTHHSAALNRPLMVGYMEMAKQAMIKHYLET